MEVVKEVEQRRGKAVLAEQQEAAANLVSNTSDQEQRNVAVVEQVNVSE